MTRRRCRGCEKYGTPCPRALLLAVLDGKDEQ